MYVVVIDKSPQSAAGLLGRITAASGEADLKTVEAVQLDATSIAEFNWKEVSGCVIGPSSYEDLEEILERVSPVFQGGLIAAVLDDDTYATQAIQLSKRLRIHLIPLSGIVQLGSFLVECERKAVYLASGGRGQGPIGICQLKGGVGATTITAALAACWAKNGLSVAAIDLDDVNPQLTAWARVGLVQRTVTSEFLRCGEVPAARVNELVHPVEGFDGRLVVVGQPEAYNESFHFKANVIDGAPSSSDFIRSLFSVLVPEFDVVIVDMGRSWGIANFAALQLCQSLVMVSDDDGMSVRRTIDAFQRLRQESDDPNEFDLAKWRFLLNRYSGELVGTKEVAHELSQIGFPFSKDLVSVVPYSETGRQWGAPGQSFYELAESEIREDFTALAASFVPFRYQEQESSAWDFLKKIPALFQF